VAAVAALLVSLAAAGAGAGAAMTPSGDQLLARAAIAPGLRSYAVPLTLNVHLHKPIGARTKVEATAYFKAPARAAIVITRATGIIGGFFRGGFNLDMVPQAWPRKYHVLSVTAGSANGVPVEVLRAVPRGNAGDVDAVIFTVTKAHLAPVAAQWLYRDNSTITLAYTNGPVGTYTLPQTATIAVDMPKYALDASGTYGSYALNAPVDDSVFATAK